MREASLSNDPDRFQNRFVYHTVRPNSGEGAVMSTWTLNKEEIPLDVYLSAPTPSFVIDEIRLGELTALVSNLKRRTERLRQ